tara:strand:+ start:274 stop:2385 length:2112 start_codon:yes stop_codon:yes gene_type:complete
MPPYTLPTLLLGLACTETGIVHEVECTNLYVDNDGDGYGAGEAECVKTSSLDSGLSGYSTNNLDCDDYDENVTLPSTWYADNDEDGYGNIEDIVTACLQPSGYTPDNTDCDDTNYDVNPTALEYCNEIDDDCDELIDEEAVDAPTWYRDYDADNYGNPNAYITSCDQPEGYLEDNTDCEDDNFNVNPGVEEICNGIDDNCDDIIDEDGLDFYLDRDGDGYGDPATKINSCEELSGYILNGEDCDDTDYDVNPAAEEVCNDYIDNDCDGTIDILDEDICLSAADATFLGENNSSQAGFTVAGAGDTNGDGYDEVLIFSSGDSAAYLHNGPASGTIYLSSADAKLEGLYGNISFVNKNLAGLGDTNGDTLDDIVLGSYDKDTVFILHGPITSLDLASNADANITGSNSFGRTVAAARDLDGDSYNDLLVGAPGSGNSTGSLHGFLAPFSGSLTTEDAYLTIDGNSGNDSLGWSADGIDFDGDGNPDLALGTPFMDTNGTESGSVHLLLGPVSGNPSLGDADAEYWGENSFNDAGRSVSGSGDTDGDGKDDLLVGAPTEDTGDYNAGAAYLILGGSASDDTLANADTKMTASIPSGYLGTSVKIIGDVDNDGNDDILVAGYAGESWGRESGATFLMYGPLSSGTIDLETDADEKIIAENTDDRSGNSVDGLDYDGDGKTDLLIGVPRDDENGSNAGAAHVILGSGL